MKTNARSRGLRLKRFQGINRGAAGFFSKSIRNRILAIVLLSTLVALIVATVALLAYEVRNARRVWITELTTQAQILAQGSGPAVAFDDRKAASSNLQALRGKRNIRAAAIYGTDHSVLAGFADGGAMLPTSTPADGQRIEGNTFQVAVPIMEAQQRLGTAYLQSTYGLGERIRDYLLILLGIMLMSLMVALLFSATLQASITRPLLALTEAARRVVQSRDFSQRVQKTTEDEIGVFVDAFNTMIEEVGTRARALEAADRHKDEFLATLAHELRNPLAPMLNAVAILERSPDPEMRARARGMLARQLAHLVRLVNDLLDVSRISTGKLTVQREPVDLGAILLSAVETVRPLIEQRRHELVADVPSSKSCVLGDETRLSQVFINLLNNAAKYTPSGGRIELTLATSEDHATVRISDSGIGIDASKLSNVFDMFTQIENRLEREQSGLGVGLALSKRMVELHEGSIEASSCGVGLGSTFTVRLPLISSGAVNAEEKPQLASSIAQRRVLLVDDNVEYALSLSMILGSLGHDVKVAHDGPTALNIVSEWRPDFACLDIGMPGMSGYELARRLRASSGCAEIMLIAITGWGQERDREMAKQAGFDHHLVKPVHSEAIVALMEKTAVSGTVNEAATVASGERL